MIGIYNTVGIYSFIDYASWDAEEGYIILLNLMNGKMHVLSVDNTYALLIVRRYEK